MQKHQHTYNKFIQRYYDTLKKTKTINKYTIIPRCYLKTFLP